MNQVSREKVRKRVADFLESGWRTLPGKNKRDLIKVLVAIENYHKTHFIECYQPQPHQLKFHCAPNRIRFIFGGNQSGKTYAGKMEAAMHFTGNYPDWFPKTNRLEQPTSGCIMVKDFPHGVGEIMEPALVTAIPPRYIRKIKRNSQGFITSISSLNGSRIVLVTHDMDTKALEGTQYDWFWPDEPPPRDKWVAVQRGLIRRRGLTFGTCTPLDQPWIYDDIYLNSDCFTITVSIDENKYLGREEIEHFVDMLTEDEKEARRFGKFMHLSGLVYKEFDANTHIVDDLPPDFDSLPKWQVVDPHTRRPFALIYFAVDTMDRIWIYDEWPKEDFHRLKASSYTPKDYAILFKDMELRHNIHRRIMDGRFCKQPQGSGGDSLLEIFDDLGIHFEPSYITTSLGTSDPGHIKVKEKLRVSPVTARPDLFVHRSCKNTIYSFQHNTWDESRKEGVIKEKPSEYAKDFLDCIRYGLMDNPCYNETGTLPDFGRSKWVNQHESKGSYGAIQDW